MLLFDDEQTKDGNNNTTTAITKSPWLTERCFVSFGEFTMRFVEGTFLLKYLLFFNRK